ncbi:hypothetical protein H5T88_06770 [bacterium]|nr:hypothetical protein [bacterium]
MRKLFLLFTIVPIVVLLTGCGGGGGGGVSKPPAPENFVADRVWVKNGTNLTQKVTLSWELVDGAQLYKVYIQVEGQTAPTFLKEISSSEVPYTYNLPSDLYVLDIDFLVSAVVNGVEGELARASAPAPPPPSPF